MRKFLLFILCIPAIGFAQNYNNPGGTHNTCSGNFRDTGGNGGDYGNNESIVTTFCSNNGTCVEVNFTQFDLESGFDFLTIYDGPNTASPIIGTYTGTTSPGTVTSTTGCLTFEFTSDFSVTAPGWRANISCVACGGGGGPINTCTGNYYDSGGSGGNYGNNENTTETYCSDNGDCIEMQFTTFDIESGFDFLTIYDGPNVASPLIGTYTGTTSPGTVVSTTGCLTFNFTSDGSVTDIGWATNITCNPCGAGGGPGTSTCTGNYYDSGGSGGNYGNNENNVETYCSDSTTGECIQMNFTTFDIESGFDELTIYDGPNIASPVIGTYTGTGSPGLVISSTGCLTFEFTSDGSVTDVGWEAAISCDTCGATPPPSSQNCDGAIPVCDDATFAGNSNGFGVQELHAGNRGCITGDENQTTWFGFSPIAVGTIELLITPTAGAIDYDFAIWGPYPSANCPVTGAPIRCSWAAATGPTGLQTGAGDNSEGAGGDRFVESIIITPAELGQIYYLMVDNFTANTTPFTLDWTLSDPNMLDCTPPLPIELSTFNGEQDGAANRLFWTTQVEVNNDYFIIERSDDAVNYTELGRVAGAGNSNNINNYELFDPAPYHSTYYKLIQVDYDGSTKEFGPILIENEAIIGLAVNKVYPNPADQSFMIDVETNHYVEADLYIYDSYGREVQTKLIKIDGSTSLEINSSEWASGVYLIKIFDKHTGFVHIDRVVIE